LQLLMLGRLGQIGDAHVVPLIVLDARSRASLLC
jgi:hypothetical protein